MRDVPEFYDDDEDEGQDDVNSVPEEPEVWNPDEYEVPNNETYHHSVYDGMIANMIYRGGNW